MASYCIKVLLVIWTSWCFVAEAQQQKTVIAGEAVEFSCTLSESLPPGDVSWRIQWDHTSTPILVNAESTIPISGSEFNSNNHGQYRTIYRSERGIRFTHYCTLIIENIQPSDAGQFSCKHVGNFRDRGIFSEHELRVLPRPPDGELPRCSQTLISAASSSPQEDMIELHCEFSGGNPPARLVWYSQGVQHGPIQVNSNDLIYRLQPSDNGVEFSCHAMSPALSETSYCHLTPLEIQPSALLEPARVEATVGADVTFTCTGEGIPSIDRIDWYVNGVLQGVGSSRGSTQSNLESTSYLTIHDLEASDDQMDVMCEVVTPTGLTADSLARIRMLTTNIPTDVRTSSPVIDPTTQWTNLHTETFNTAAMSVGMTKAFDNVNSSRTTYTKSRSELDKTGEPQTTLGSRRVKIGAKVGTGNQDASTKSKTSNIPALATGIALVFFIVIVVIFVVVKRRRSRSHKERVPSSPTDSLPVADNTLSNLNEFANQMYEGTILNTSATKTSENFYQKTPNGHVEEDPGKTWSTHEGCGVWQDASNPHYENTAIGSPFPTFAKHNAPPAEIESEEREHFIYDVVERNGENVI